MVEAAAALAIVADSRYEPHKAIVAALALTAGISFVAAGLIARRRRPDNRTGIYLAAVGYLWFLGALQDANSTTAYTAGTLLANLAFIPSPRSCSPSRPAGSRRGPTG